MCVCVCVCVIYVSVCMYVSVCVCVCNPVTSPSCTSDYHFDIAWIKRLRVLPSSTVPVTHTFLRSNSLLARSTGYSV